LQELIYSPVRKAQIFSGNANTDLANLVTNELKTPIGKRILEPFSDGEIRCKIEESVRGNYVFVIQSHGGGGIDVNTAIMEQQFLCAAAAGASASKVIAVCPYLGYSRQDRKSSGREPISARQILSNFVTAGADGIVCVDLHSGQTQGFTDLKIPIDNLTAGPILRRAMLPELQDTLTVVAPDSGATKLATEHRKRLSFMGYNVTSAYIDKNRPKKEKDSVEAMEVIGEVKGRQCLMVDDMVNTAETLKKDSQLLVKNGAIDVISLATHAVFSGNARENIETSEIRKMIVTNSRALTAEQKPDNVEVAPIQSIIAEAIKAIFQDLSISEIFDGENNK